MSSSTVLASIVTWNSAASIEECLTSLLGQSRRPDLVYVYDNASRDDTRSILEGFRSRITIVYGGDNCGFCVGHNTTISSTKSDFVLLVNPDAIMEPDYLERAVTAMNSDPKIGAVCGLLLQDNNSSAKAIVDGTGLIFTRSRRFLLRDNGRNVEAARGSAREVFGCDGALPLFRRAMIEDISIKGFFFDPAFFAHKEDHDIAWRSRLFGWKAIFEPSCIAIHPRVFRPSDLALRRRLSWEVKYHAVKNDILMLLKNEHAANFWRDFFSIVPRRLAIAVYSLILEPRSLLVYWYIFRNLGLVLSNRKEIQSRYRASAADIRRWVNPKNL
jgi:GT2 family glycosyltransferase